MAGVGAAIVVSLVTLAAVPAPAQAGAPASIWCERADGKAVFDSTREHLTSCPAGWARITAERFSQAYAQNWVTANSSDHPCVKGTPAASGRRYIWFAGTTPAGAACKYAPLGADWRLVPMADWITFVEAERAKGDDPDPTTPAPDDPPDLSAASPCPDAPAVYGGTDVVVAELRNLRREQAAVCLAEVSRLARLEEVSLSEDGNTGDVEQLLRAPLSVRLTTDGNQVEVKQREGDPGLLVRTGSPLEVVNPAGETLDVDAGQDGVADTVALSATDRDNLAEQSSSVTFGVWLLGGLLVGSFAVAQILRTFWRA